MVTFATEATITEIADFVQGKKQASERISVVLGSRAGGLFGNENLYSTLSGYSLAAFDNLSRVEKFQQCYTILSDTALTNTASSRSLFSEIEVYNILKAALDSVPRYRRDDELLVDIALDGIFQFIVTTSSDALLEDVFRLHNLKQPEDYRVIVPGIDDSASIFPNESKYASLLKVFGDFESRGYKTVGNLFDLDSDPLLKGSLGRILMDDVLVLGYDSQWDKPLELAFPKTGKSIWYIDEEPPAENTHLAEVLKGRQGRYLAGLHGSYEGFLRSIYGHVSSSKNSLKNTALVLPPPLSIPLPALVSERKNVFISYSHKDSLYLDSLKTHLQIYKYMAKNNNMQLDIWDDTRIASGEDWDNEIKKALAFARVAVLLVSADFFASDFIYNHELPYLLKAAESGEIKLLLVLLRPCAFHRTPLYRYQAENSAQPLSGVDQHQRDLIWSRLAEKVYDLFTEQK